MIILKITMMRINWQRQSEDSLVSMWNFPTLQKGSPQHNLNLLPPFIRRTVNLKSILHALSICSSLCTYVYACSSMSQWEWNVNFFNNIYRTYLYTHWRCLNLFHLSFSFSLFPISTSFCNSFFTTTEKRDEISHRSVFKRLLSLLCVYLLTRWVEGVRYNLFFIKFEIFDKN